MKQLLLVPLAALWLFSLDSAAQGRWDAIPLLDESAELTSFGVEPGGDLWAVVGGQPFFLDGDALHAPFESELAPSHYELFLVGGGDRDLYAAHATEGGEGGRLYRVTDGCVLFETEYYQANRHARPSLHVSRSGQLVSWGDRFLAVFVDGEWQRIEALLHHKETVVVETAAKVFLYYNQNLYSVDREGAFEQRAIPCPIVSVPGRNRLHAALWGDDRVLFLQDSTQELYAYELETGAPVDVDELNAVFERRRGHDLFRAAGGAVWLLVNDFDLNRFVHWEITPEGGIAPTRGTAELRWRNLRHWQYPESVLAHSDGSLWFGIPLTGVARYLDGAVRSFDWRHGLDGEFRRLREGPDGLVYAASSRSLFRFRPDAATAEIPAWAGAWEELRLASAQPLRDFEGNVWVFLEEHPGELSRWDGSVWTHFEVPFETRRVGRVMADDRGHVLAAMSSYPDGCFDVGPDGVRRHRNLRDMLVAAVADGAREFLPDSSFQGCVVDEAGRIWFGYQGHAAVEVFDGRRWDSLAWKEPIYYLWPSSEHGVVFRTQSHAFLAYDRGQLQELPISFELDGRWLLGPRSFQPFDEGLARTGRFLPVERRGGRIHVLRPRADTLQGDARDPFELGERLPERVTLVMPGFEDGHWSRFPRAPLHRFFGPRVLTCDFRRSPLLGRQSSVESVVEDRARNLWIDTGSYFGTRSVFVKRMDGFRIRAPGTVTDGGRTLTARPVVSSNGEALPGAPLFWRIDGSAWRGGDPGPVTIEFPADGEYEVEVVAMGPLGGITPTPLRWKVDVRAPRPETRLRGEGPYASDDVVWSIPAVAVAAEPGAAAQLAFRFESGEWQPARRGNQVYFAEREAGEYELQVAAFQSERDYDLTPLELRVTYEPDYRAMVERRLDRMVDAEHEELTLILEELRCIGPQTLPYLQERLVEARKAARLADLLEVLVDLILHQYR